MTQLTDPNKVQRVAVVGAGTIGASWAVAFLSRGMRVAVYDPRPEAEAMVRHYIERAWPTVQQLGISENADLSQIVFSATLEDAVRDAQLVQENGPENLEIKRKLLSELDAVLPDDAVVASSSSGLLVSKMQEGLGFADRLVLGHPFNPPHLMPLVEIVGGEKTSHATTQWALAFYRAMGKRPILLKREVPGHIANRLAAALWREAIHLAVEGVASVADIDAAVRFGPGVRWACMGPHMTYHLGGGEGGIEHFMQHLGPVFEGWWQELGNPALTPQAIETIVAGTQQEAGDRSLDDLAVERDKAVVSILRILEAQGDRLP